MSSLFKEMIFQIVTCAYHFHYKFPELSPDDSSSEYSMHIIMSLILSTPGRRNLKVQQSPDILDLCLKKTWAVKSRDYRDVIRFQKIFRPL